MIVCITMLLHLLASRHKRNTSSTYSFWYLHCYCRTLGLQQHTKWDRRRNDRITMLLHLLLPGFLFQLATGRGMRYNLTTAAGPLPSLWLRRVLLSKVCYATKILQVEGSPFSQCWTEDVDHNLGVVGRELQSLDGKAGQ
jgi:hypothetical protein